MTTDNNHTDQQVPIEGLTGAFVTKDNIALYDVLEELQRIRDHYPPLGSTHEGLGVLMEEFDEFQREVYKRPSSFRADLMRREAIQVASVAVRICADLAHEESKLDPRTVLMRDQAEAQCDRMRERWLASGRERDSIQGSHDHCSELLNMFCEHFGLPLGAGDLGIRIEAAVTRNKEALQRKSDLYTAAESLLAELTAAGDAQSEGAVNAAKKLGELL